MATTTHLLTFEEFEALPNPPEGKLELIEGEVHLMSPPVWRHSEVATAIRDALFLYFLSRENTYGRILQEAGFLMRDSPRSWLVPDVAVMQPDQARDKYLIGAPLLAVEVPARRRQGSLGRPPEHPNHLRAQTGRGLRYPPRRPVHVRPLPRLRTRPEKALA